MMNSPPFPRDNDAASLKSPSSDEDNFAKADIMEVEEVSQARRIQRAMLSRRLGLRGFCALLLMLLAVFYTLYIAVAIIMPFVFALVINLLMVTPMRFLHNKIRLPKPIAALLLILAMFALVAMIAAAISVPATAWFVKLPQSWPMLQKKLQFFQGPLTFLEHGFSRIFDLFSLSSGVNGASLPSVAGQADSAETLRVLGSSVLMSTRTLMGEFFSMMLILYFLMTQGDALLRRVVEILPTYSEKQRMIQITSQIERNVSLYLATITIMNLLVGLLNFIQCTIVGMPNPLLWGVLAFLLNYVPIIGPLTGVFVYFFVGLLSFSSLLYALIPPSIYLCIHILEGEMFTPILLAKRFTLNPVLIIVSLIFWDWMWGIGGAFLSVPLLAVFKIFCDHIEALSPVGYILGAPVRPIKLGNLRARSS